MDRGRNLEALAEEDDEEEMDEEHLGDSDSETSTSSDDDDMPDEGIKRGEPNKFDILCDGVNNAMALVHTAMEELLDMKDEMLKHALPPTVLIKLATITGKVFRSISDLNMPVNEMLRLVRVYSTPWEEKSAALKKLHEDYEAKQRQLNIAIKRLQLVDAHSKRIAREKRVMNWEKLFAKVMSNKGHGRRWKFLIETIKQKAKLGLEHVQEFTKQLDESSDEEEDEMPAIQLKRHGAETPTSTSDKVSLQNTRKGKGSRSKGSKSKKSSIKDPDSVQSTATVKFEGETENEEGEDEEGEGEKAGAGSEAGSEDKDKDVPSINIHEALQGEEEEDTGGEEEGEEGQEGRRSRSSESSKKVRFAPDEKRGSPAKVEVKDAEAWTAEPEYDNYLHVRLYGPIGMKQKELKCSVTYGKQFYKTKQLDDGITEQPAEQEPSEIKKKSYEEAKFTLPDPVPEGVWMKEKQPEPVTSCQITIHSGTTEAIVAMATINIADLKEVELRTVYLDAPHGDDDVPRSPEPPGADDDLDSLSSDMDIPLPDEDAAKKKEPAVEEDKVKDVDPTMFPLYSLDGSSSTHKPCGFLPLVMYWAKKNRPTTFNRQVGTHGVTELVFEMTGIDLHTTSKEELHKEMVDETTSVVHFTPDVQDRALSAIRFTPEPANPPTSPEHESIPEQISPDVKEESEVIEEAKPTEEMITKLEYDKMMEKHSKDMLFLQEEYEKRMQSLVSNLQQLDQNQQVHQQQIMKQQQQIAEQQKMLSSKRGASAGARTHSPASVPPPGTPQKKVGSAEVTKPVIHGPMPPQKPRPSKRRQPVAPPRQEGVPDEFLERLQYFEDETYRNKQELAAKTRQNVQEEIERKLAGQHKLSQKNDEMFEALNDVSLPALFMPFQTGNVFNPRAHQYFHPSGSTDMRLTQPPSVFQLPPLNKSSSVLNLFELSKNFHHKGPGWLMDRYIAQQEPVRNAHGMVPHASLPTSQFRSPPYTPQPTYDLPSTRGAGDGQGQGQRTREAELECDS